MARVDGVHDLGGLHGFGAIPIERDEPLFHEPWEARVWAMWGVICPTVDRFRWTIERMPPPEYLASSYYERWLWAFERLAAEQGLLESDRRPPRTPMPSPSEPIWEGRFRLGQRVRVRNVTTAAHTRVPRYLRLHEGVVERVAFAWCGPTDSAATGRYGDNLQLFYTVAFAGADLFEADADHTITADLGEGDLEVA
jgi:nitrile hydratase